MGNTQSVQALKIINQFAGQDNMMSPNENHGRVRVSFFNYVTTATDVANGTIELNDIPINARVLRGELITGALGAGVTASIGPGVINGGTNSYGAVVLATKYLNAGNVAAAGNLTFANTVALNQGVLLATREHLLLTFGATAPAAGIIIQGFIEYVVD